MPKSFKVGDRARYAGRKLATLGYLKTNAVGTVTAVHLTGVVVLFGDHDEVYLPWNEVEHV